ncbi:2Fe-2S iron-sulfur cluster-binding protein [Streptomyces sp. NPDC048389]|uniref:2Fe-2S iron-sulfur cluster-binding protein n=1 Tax=Streptomyces sp. NPDC048389 TaxID=3154622 RepID=UPI003455FC0C
MSNEDNPHGLPPEFRLPEGSEPEHRGDRYDGHERQERYEQPEEHERYVQHEQRQHVGRYEQAEQYDPYGAGSGAGSEAGAGAEAGAYDAYGSYGGQGGGWQPTPQGGEYDGEATAFFQLPPEATSDTAPLEAPGHGYVPPVITPLTPAAGTDPASTGGWASPPQWPEPAARDASQDASGAAEAGGTGQWSYFQETGPAVSSEGDSGEFPLPPGADAPWRAAAPPATLPGGAPAPWATLPGGAAAPWAEGQPEPADSGPGPEPAAAVPVAEDDATEDPGPPMPVPAEVHAETEREAAAPSPEFADASAETSRAPGEQPAAESGEPAAEPEPEGAAVGPATGPGPAPAPVPEPARERAPAPEPEPEPAHDHGPALDPGAASAEPTAAPADVLPPGNEEHPPTSYVLRVNGTDRPVSDAWIGESLLYVLRERLGLAGAKDGCSQGECGACNVQVDGRLVASCLVPAATAAGSEVRTVEGLATGGEPSDVQRALAACGAVQCGFCIPGMAMTVHDLLEGNHAPTELETRQALCGNLCRCSGYRGVLDAVRQVVAGRAASAAAAAEAAETPDAGDEARIPHQAPPGAGSVQIHPHDGGMA